MSKETDPNHITLFAGLSGCSYEHEPFELGDGVVLSPSYAHLMSPYIMAFSPATPGKAHPGPWKHVRGGNAFDVTVQIEVPGRVRAATFDHLNTVWWLAALLRLRGLSSLRVPVVSDIAFAEATTSGVEPRLWPVETAKQIALTPSERDKILHKEDLAWLSSNWRGGANLMQDGDFNTAMQAFDQCAMVTNPGLALLLLWGGLERLFSPARHELRFRISATIAAFLLPPGRDRHEKYHRIKKLYDERSRIAHGAEADDPHSLHETYVLMRTVLTKMIEERHVPTRAELESTLFGVAEN